MGLLNLGIIHYSIVLSMEIAIYKGETPKKSIPIRFNFVRESYDKLVIRKNSTINIHKDTNEYTGLY